NDRRTSRDTSRNLSGVIWDYYIYIWKKTALERVQKRSVRRPDE
ncbi:unnamed protein product, partial [Amoebophrya sp. A120]